MMQQEQRENAAAVNGQIPVGDAKIDWKALGKRIGFADVAFTMKQYVQTVLEADRQVANAQPS